MRDFMKKTLFFAILIATGPSGLGQCPEQTCPNFTATLTGANAIPPNSSPFTTTAKVYGPQPFPLAPFAYSIYVFVEFPQSLFTNYPDIIPAVASLQHRDGSLVTDGDFPFILNRVSGPLTQTKGETDFDGRFLLTREQFAELAAGEWYVNVSFETKEGTPVPDDTIRGEILPLDSDDDGVQDYLDQCPNTPNGAIVDSRGCSIDQLCPCDGPWRNHGEYVTCVSRTAAQFQREGLISESERRNIVNVAIRSNCGKQ